MSVKGIYCTILIGPNVPAPLPTELTEVVHTIEVVHRSSSRSGFQIEFYAGRAGIVATTDYPILSNPLLTPFNRVTILVAINGIQQMLMDGIITHVELVPSDQPGQSRLLVRGQDVSIMMDRKKKMVSHPAQPEALIATKIITDYAQYQLVPQVIPPAALDTPNPTDWVPRQFATDYRFLQQLAKRYGYVFYVATGPVPKVNTAYWGPPKRVGVPQAALSANMGPGRNVNEIYFRQNSLLAATVSGQIQDRLTNTTLPILTPTTTRVPLSLQSASITNTEELLFEDWGGLDYIEAQARAQAITDYSRDRVVVAEGSLDTERYGNLLQARSLIGVNGAGTTNDGLYYVEEVIHTLGSGYYQQQFTLTRDGTGTTVPAVIP